MFFEGMRLGVARIFLYELLGDNSLAIIDGDNNPRQAFYGVRNLVQLFSEKGQNSFATHDFDISITGAPSSVHHLILEKSTGTWYLAIWNDAKTCEWMQDALGTWYVGEVVNARIPVTIDFGQTIDMVRIYEPAVDSLVKTTYQDISQCTVEVPDHPQVIECSIQTATIPQSVGAVKVNHPGTFETVSVDGRILARNNVVDHSGHPPLPAHIRPGVYFLRSEAGSGQQQRVVAVPQ